MVDFSLFNKQPNFMTQQPAVAPAIPTMNTTAANMASLGNAQMFPEATLGADQFDFMNPATTTFDNATAAGGTDWMSKLFGNKKTGAGGMVTPGLNLLSAGLQFWQGKQGMDLAKDQLKTQKSQFNKQYDTQKQLINTDIQDSADRRADRTGQANDYYEKNKIA